MKAVSDVEMASSICILLVLFLSQLVEMEGRAVDGKHIIVVPDEYPSRCDDPKAPCKCLDKNSTRITKDDDGVHHEISFVSHLCDVEMNKDLEQPANLKCKQIVSELFVFQLNKFLPYKSGCELRCEGDCVDTLMW